MPSRDPSLLILDDDARLAQFIADVATPLGWQVTVTQNVDAFQHAYAEQPPAAIVLDLHLGASDGIEQLRFLSAAGYGGPIILISGTDPRVLASARRVGEALGAHIVDTIEKPARAARVRAILQDLVRGPPPSEGPIVAAPATSVPAVTPTSIAQAIDAGALELFLQPIVNRGDRRATRAEALARWRGPDGTLIPPDRFIPIAEQDPAVMDRLTLWVIGEAAALHLRLSSNGPVPHISVNVSGTNLRELDFQDRVEAILRQSGVPSSAIGLEITETVAVHQSQTSADVLTRLRLKGFTLAVDDFGTGHATLESIRHLPFSTLKIDRLYVAEMTRSPEAAAIVGSVIRLADSLGLESVAEGVETQAVADLLTALKVGAMQGHLFSEPLPEAAFAAWLRGRAQG